MNKHVFPSLSLLQKDLLRLSPEEVEKLHILVRHIIDDGSEKAFAQISNKAFSAIWDNDDDAEYDSI